ncbi:alpha/beta fold hydrolase [Thalassospiraceae bacterium LMO-JJ14]|nr:alpha/beta fold hydrolase [Thalassospiraceae bacterium LMO-JJ14]
MTDGNPGFIFLHGFLGRAETRIAGMRFEYFRGLSEVLSETGATAIIPHMPGRAGIEARAACAAAEMSRMPMPELAVVGVSMGGLVARALAAHHDPDRRIRTVVSIATPHRGSPLAERALSAETRLPGWLVDQFAPAFHDLTSAGARAFNARTPDRADVRYLSWGFSRERAEMPLILKRRQKRIFDLEGPNDGMVSVASSRWGETFTEGRADHFETIGWSPKRADPKTGRPFDQQQLWRDVIRACREGAQDA